MPRRLHVFTGYTLDAAAVRKAAPEATVHPPVVAGDLSRLDLGAGDVVVIVDGAMTGGSAVRHKEILGLVASGVEVWGAGALGALRGAELHDYGMHAHGRVARLFIRGVLDADDEVAVAPETPGAVPLVDVRATCRAACRGGLIDPESAGDIVVAAQALPARRRTWAEIVGHAVDAGLDADMAWRVEEFAREHQVRLTREDALSCLATVRRRRAQPPRPRRTRPPVLTAFVQAWREETAGAEVPGAGFVADLAVLTLCRLLAVDYPAFQRRVALRTLAALAAPDPRPGERDGRAIVRGFSAEQGLDADSLPLWLDERGLRRDELVTVLRRDQAVGVVLEAFGTDPGDDEAVEATLAEVVAEHARRRGVIGPSATPGWDRAWLSAAEESLPAEQRIARLAARSFHSMPGVDWRQPLLQELKRSGVFRVAREAVVQARQFLAEQSRTAEPRDEEILGWFTRRWDAGDRFDLALLDRGFAGVEAFLPRARPFVAFDQATATYRELRCLGRRAALASS